jgi:hypothetical protein
VNTHKEIDLDDDETPEIKVRLSHGEAGAQMKHFLKVLVEFRGEPSYKGRIQEFLDWFPNEKLEGFLLLALEYAVDKVQEAGRRGKGRGGRGNHEGGPKRP